MVRRRPAWFSRWAAPLLATTGALTVLALAASPAGAAPEGGDAWLREQLVGPDRLAGFGVSADVQVPVTKIVGGSGTFFDEIRNGSIRTSHRRSFVSFDGVRDVQIRVTEYVNHAFATAIGKKQTDRFQFDPPLHAPDGFGVTEQTRNGTFGVYVVETRGRVVAEIIAHTGDSGRPGTVDEARALARQVADAQYDSMLDSVNLTERTTVSVMTAHYMLLLGIMWFLVVLQVLAALIAVLRDRSIRERLVRWVLRRRTPALVSGVGVIDVTRAARVLRRRHRYGVVLRNSGLAALVVVTYNWSAAWQVGIIAGLGFLASLVELAAARLSNRNGLRAAYGAAALVARMLTTTVTVFLFAFACLLLLVPIVASGLVPAGYTPFQTRQAALLFLSAGLLVIGLADLVNLLGRRLALRSARRILAHDGRPEILFLRSFMDDRLTIRAHRTGRQSVLDRLTLRRFERFEEILAWALWRFGPVVALGDDWLPPLGAARVSVPTGTQWEDIVRDKLPHAGLIVMSTGRTRSVVDEIGMIRAAQALAKTIFVFPPVTERELRQRLDFVTQALDLRRDLLQPAYQPRRRLLALSFDAIGHPVFVLGDSRDDLSYQAAIDRAAAQVQARQPTTVSAPEVSVQAQPDPNEPRLAPVSVPRKARRRAARRRFWALAPWVLNGVLILSGQIFAVEPSAPLPPVPGDVVSRIAASGLVTTGTNTLLVADAGHRTIVAIDASGHATTVQKLTATPIQLIADTDVVYVTTTNPPGLVALKTTPLGYSAVWTASLPSVPVSAVRVGTRVFASLPVLDAVVALDAGKGTTVGSVRTVRGPYSLAASAGDVVIASVTDSTLTWVDAKTLKASGQLTVDDPSMLVRTGTDLLIGSTLESSLTLLDLTNRTVLAHTNGILVNNAAAMADGRVAVATYNHPAQLVMLDRNLRQTGSMTVPSQIYVLAFTDAGLVCSLADEPAVTVVRRPE
jgi:hypothetical protein